MNTGIKVHYTFVSARGLPGARLTQHISACTFCFNVRFAALMSFVRARLCKVANFRYTCVVCCTSLRVLKPTQGLALRLRALAALAPLTRRAAPWCRFSPAARPLVVFFDVRRRFFEKLLQIEKKNVLLQRMIDTADGRIGVHEFRPVRFS